MNSFINYYDSVFYILNRHFSISLKEIDELEISEANILLKHYHDQEENEEIYKTWMLGIDPARISRFRKKLHAGKKQTDRITSSQSKEYENLFSVLITEKRNER